MKSALIVRGGWDGHEPVQVSELFASILRAKNFSVEVSESLDSFLDEDRLSKLDLIVPVWTMGKISEAQLKPVLKAVEGGVGLAGCHGGMCDAFRESCDWQFMTGGQWVAHPGNDGVEYLVRVIAGSSPIVEGIDDFKVKSEQYYLHVDPAVRVLATTDFPVAEGPHSPNGRASMPVAWTKHWGRGRVFYSSLGHHADVFDAAPARLMMERGLFWAAK
jgi:type 1 glutamine amidotransferase